MDNSTATPHLPHFPSILKLDRSNYSFWRAQALSAIRAHGYGDFISPTAVSPSMFLPSQSAAGGNTLNPAYGVWLRRDQFLLSWMLSSVSEAMLGHVVRCSTSCEFWLVLERLFMSQSKARIMQLRLLLQSTKKGALSVEEYFLKMRGFADQLTAVGQVISDEELVTYLLSGFGQEYEALVVNMMHRSDSPNLQEVQYAFQAYELRIQQQTSSLMIDHSAHIAYRGQGQGRGFNPQSRGGSTAARGGGSSKGIVCQLCGRTGHVAIKCFKRFDIHFTDNSTVVPNIYRSTIDQEALSTDQFSAENTSTDPTWYMDSGATTHITNSMQNLAVSSPYSGTEKLVVGNGQPNSQDPPEGHPI